MTKTILKNKYYLYLTEFFAGMALMAVELGASRLMAPYFSSSQIVWTIIISTIMIAMALGNLYGGRSADKDPDPDRLYRRLLIAAVWISAIPVLGKYLILGITGLLIVTISRNLLTIAGFLACMAIFVFPCFLLGTVTPSLTKYALLEEAQSDPDQAEGLEKSGSIVGRLGAANTIGSIIGTFTPTFITIPAVGTAVTFLLFSGIILIIALVYFISCRTRRTACIIACVLFALFAVFGARSRFAFWEKDLTYEGESIYNYLQVKENDEEVVLSTNVMFGVQSILKKDDSLSGMYYDCAMAALYMRDVSANPAREDSPRILILGNGTGTYARQCLKYLPDSRVTGVEIDQSITDLAREYFDMPGKVKVTTYDGRAYLQADKNLYDVIMVDAYQDISIPFQMASAEFFTMVRDHLDDGGVMVVNMNMRASGENSINDYLTDTIAHVFPYVSTADVENYTNRELFASMNRSAGEVLRERAGGIADGELRRLIGRVSLSLEEKKTEREDRILTDDRAPVEMLSMRAIDEIIAGELAYYKDVYHKEGLKGILDSM